MNYTDGIILALFPFFRPRLKKGFFRCILGPFALGASLLVAHLHYQRYEDVLMALGISILGPFCINLGFGIIFKLLESSKRDEQISPLSYVSRTLGGIFSLSWQGAIAVMAMILLLYIPFNIPKLDAVQENIQGSFIYEIINSYTGKKLPEQTLNVGALQEAMKNPETVERVQKSESFQNVMANARMQEILNRSRHC